jgi:flagellin
MQTASDLNLTTNSLQNALQQLTTGLRINSAANDAAGLAITSMMGNVIDGMNQANINVQNGINMIQTADSAAGQINSILGRMQTLANEAANTTLTTADRVDIQQEVTQLTSDINNIASSTNFNGVYLLTGKYSAGATGAGLQIQYGAYAANTYKVAVSGLTAGALGVNALSVTQVAGANTAITTIQSAVSSLASMRANLGAYQNGLQYLSNNLQTSLQNLTASQASIQDTDVATEMAKFTSLQILQQSGTAMLAQANALPQTALKLLS